MRFALVEGGVLFAAVLGTIVFWGDLLLADWIHVATAHAQAAVISFCSVVAFYHNDLYDFRVVRSLSEFASRLLRSSGMTLILLAGFYMLFPETKIADGPFVSSLLIIAALLLPVRAIGYAIMRHRTFVDRVLALGTGLLARKLIEEIEARPNFGYVVVGVADDGDAPDEISPRHHLLGPLEHLGKIIEEVRPDRIVIAMTERRGRLPMRQLLEAETCGIVVEDGIRTYEQFTGKLAIEALTPSTLVFSDGFRKTRRQLALRRVASLVGAAGGLLLSAPVMAVIALAIKLDSPGPVFFIHERAGRRGRPFKLVKFRTMRHSQEPLASSVWERDDSARITRVGRWLRKLRLDELPQFWNILKGEMNLIGPRPEIIDNVTTMTAEIPYYALRHVINPGLTGWAQVRYGYSVSFEQVTEKMRYDLFYIKNMSLWLDLRILAETVKIVVFGRGVV